MRINSKDKIGGQSILKVRRLLRLRDEWTLPFAARVFGLSHRRTRQLMKVLEAEGYVQPGHITHKTWAVTQKGSTLACATAAQPMFRHTAEKQLAEFLTRVEDVRQDGRFLYKVGKAYIFGSYLSDADRINDIDIAVELLPKEKHPEKQKSVEWQRVTELMDEGKQLNVVEQQFWPRIEVEKYLRSRSRISLHSLDDLEIDLRAKLIYQDKTDAT